MEMKKKSLKKNIEGMKTANSSSIEVIDFVVGANENQLTEEEKEGLRQVKSHLVNMNTLFSNLQKGI